MSIRRLALAIGVVPLVAMSGAVLAAEKKEEYTAPEAKTEQILHQMGLAAGEKLEAKLIRFDIPPGFQGGRHSHSGDLVVYVLQGSVNRETAKGPRTFTAGQAFYEVPGEVMSASNQSTDEETVLLVFQVGVQGEPLMVKAD